MSGKVARSFEEKLRREHPEARIVRRSLAESPAPHLSDAAVHALGAKDQAGAAALKLSDELIGEVLGSDVIVIATPMWNFGVPSSVKAWVDHVLRAGKTFAYSEKGPVGLAAGKKAVVIVASGGVYGSGPMASFDFVTPYLQRVLNFIGIQDVRVVRVEGTAVPQLAAAALPNAQKAVEALVI